MEKTIKSTLIGAGLGAGVGTVSAGIATATSLCPPVWPIVDAVTAGATASSVAKVTGLSNPEQLLVGAVAGALGFTMGMATLPIFPVRMAFGLLTAPLAIPFYTAVGAYVGYDEAKKASK